MKSKFASAFFAGALTAGTVFGAHATASAESVKFLMNWVFGGQHVAFFAARDRGFFKKNGLDVTLLQGRGSGKAATDVDTKQVEYSYGDLLAATHLISKGGKNRAVGVGEVFQGGAFMSLEKTGIQRPKDLEGKRMGGNPGAFGNVLLPAMAAASGFDHAKVIQKTMKSSLLTPALLEGKIDFFAGARGSSLPRMAILAKRQGLKLNYLSFKDMGIETYGYVIQAHQDRIEKNPGQVQKFVAAVFDAWAWSIQHPKEAFETFMKANPEKDREISQAQVEEGISDVRDPETKGKGLGYMKESQVKKSVEIANKYFRLSPAVGYKATYTNRFIRPNPGL